MSARGRFVWHELMTTDTAAAAAFYTKVIGWKTQPFEQDPTYTMWVAKSGPVGGVMKLPDDAKAMGAPPHWLPYINTTDVDATVRQANQLGAKTLFGPNDIPNVGRFAVMQDPQGAVFATYKSSGPPMPMSDKPGVGECS